VLRKLSQDEYWYVRYGVASNPMCHPAVLAQLSDDSHPQIRQQVANNPACPVNTLIDLLKDPVAAYLAAANPHLPRSALAMWQLAHDQA
jgi:hypothetical protein